VELGAVAAYVDGEALEACGGLGMEVYV